MMSQAAFRIHIVGHEFSDRYPIDSTQTVELKEAGRGHPVFDLSDAGVRNNVLVIAFVRCDSSTEALYIAG
jgi:hypothetical protein